jgi:hypothetical protein
VVLSAASGRTARNRVFTFIMGTGGVKHGPTSPTSVDLIASDASPQTQDNKTQDARRRI